MEEGELPETEENADFWDQLDEKDKAAINEGLEQLQNGQHVESHVVREEIIKRFHL